MHIASLALALTLSSAGAPVEDGGTRLLRFPDIHGDRVVFCYGGDLWRAPAEGGTASRLTAHPGREVFPRFSPDGKWIAFTGQYDGDEQVYVMPSEGGEPRRLTWYPAQGPLPPRWGFDHQVFGWTPDGSSVLFRSLRDGGGGVDGRLYTVPVEGGLPEALPMPGAGSGDLSPDASRVVYSPLGRDFRHWKRYEGGWAQDLYVFDPSTSTHKPLAHSARTERDPMWVRDQVIFSSDRSDHLCLYAADPDAEGGEARLLSDHSPADVRWPATDHDHRVVYEVSGALWVYDLNSGQRSELTIHVPDDGLWKRERRVSVDGSIGWYGLSPAGERALFVARGEVFSAPAEKGRTINLTESSGANDRIAAWSPLGGDIAYISDASGEDEIWLVSHEGKAEPRRLTEGGKARLTNMRWSPDGERIAYTDYQGRLRVVTVADGSITEVADEAWWGVGGVDWSPDGAFLAFGLRNEAQLQQIHIWSVASGRVQVATSEMASCWSPSWGPNGDYLFYLSDRHYAPQISDLEWDYAGNKRAGIYGMALRGDVAPLFPAEDDSVAVSEDKEEDAADGEAEEDEVAVEIEFDGLAQRVIAFPVANNNYGGLSAIDGHLLYTTSGPFVYGGSGGETVLHRFSLEDREAEEVATGVGGYALSADRSKLMVRAGGGFTLHDAAGGGEGAAVSTSGLVMNLNPEEEWQELFTETWRLFRDYFYVENMHGYDWEQLGEQYGALLPHVAHRSDLNYVISEMIGELNAGHTYVSGGDFENPDRPQVALPGVRFELDADSGRYRVASVFVGHNEERKYRSPLTEVGSVVKAGEYVLAINGTELVAPDNPYRLLQNLEGAVTLTVHTEPRFDGAREVEYRPISSESSLVYLAWVKRNHDMVTRLSGGKVGYLHIPNMGADGIAEFIKWYYPQIRKQGMVIDVRSNGGGNVSSMIIERLGRRVLGTRFGRVTEHPTTYPSTAFHGHLVCLTSETSASDGDIFPYYFREAGLGPLIGKRTWGGVVGGGNIGLVDGGAVFVPRSATNDAEGNYIIEGVGVAPDIEVENDPASVLEGRDPQLERGVKELLDRIASEPKSLPARPADPVKTPEKR